MSSPDCPQKPPAGLTRLAAREVCALAIVGAVLGGLAFWATAPRIGRIGDAGGRSGRISMLVGDRTCGQCHPGESAAHARSGHSHTLRPAAKVKLAQQLSGLRIPDPEQPAVTWSYLFHDRDFRVERTAEAGTDRFVIDYAFGSGRHATTFFSLTDANPDHLAGLEHRLTYFARKQSLAITPGQTADEAATNDEVTPLGSRLPAVEVLHCFRCHTTLTSTDARKPFDPATMIPNVGCERCHGPGRAHVEAARRGDDNLAIALGPDRTSALMELRLCGQCHRYPVLVAPQADFEVPSSDIRPDNRLIARFQPVGLMQSACYNKSSGALRCTSCHDPHSRASRDRAAYEQVCISCHEPGPAAPGPSPRTCPVNARGGCLECHMPKRDSGQGILFTDHWIRVRKGAPSQPAN